MRDCCLRRTKETSFYSIRVSAWELTVNVIVVVRESLSSTPPVGRDLLHSCVVVCISATPTTVIHFISSVPYADPANFNSVLNCILSTIRVPYSSISIERQAPSYSEDSMPSKKRFSRDDFLYKMNVQHTGVSLSPTEYICSLLLQLLLLAYVRVGAEKPHRRP